MVYSVSAHVRNIETYVNGKLAHNFHVNSYIYEIITQHSLN